MAVFVSSRETEGTPCATAKLLCTVSSGAWCIWTDLTYFGLVPLFSFLKILSSNAFILLANITQGSSKIRLRNIHINLDVLFLELGLQFSDFLRKKQTLSVITQQHIECTQVGTLGQNQWRASLLARSPASNHRPNYSAYLIMKLLQEDNFLLQGLNFALKIKTCQRGIVDILTREKND